MSNDGIGWGDENPVENHEHFMRMALREAEAAYEEGEVPVGAVVVHGGKIIGRGHNQRELLKDPTAHAEMIAITQAAASLENWRLDRCTLYVTLEPCGMCAGAIANARVKRVVFGATDSRHGFCGSAGNLVQRSDSNHRSELVPEVLGGRCRGLLDDFFRARREKGGGDGAVDRSPDRP